MPSRRGALAATVLGAVAATVAGRSFRRLAIAERSMLPALESGDYVLGRAVRRARRGDIVTFLHPQRDDLLLVKRIIGLPGERVVVRGGQAHIGDAILAEPWANGPTHPELTIELGVDEVFVLSDNRAVTMADSRAFGSIPVAALEHRVVARYWPLSAIGRVR